MVKTCSFSLCTTRLRIAWMSVQDEVTLRGSFFFFFNLLLMIPQCLVTVPFPEIAVRNASIADPPKGPLLFALHACERNI